MKCISLFKKEKIMKKIVDVFLKPSQSINISGMELEQLMHACSCDELGEVIEMLRELGVVLEE